MLKKCDFCIDSHIPHYTHAVLPRLRQQRARWFYYLFNGRHRQCNVASIRRHSHAQHCHQFSSLRYRPYKHRRVGCHVQSWTIRCFSAFELAIDFFDFRQGGRDYAAKSIAFFSDGRHDIGVSPMTVATQLRSRYPNIHIVSIGVPGVNGFLKTVDKQGTTRIEMV